VLPGYLLVALVVVATMVAVKDWRLGLLLAIAVGMIQDPLRKLTTGAPPFLVLSSVPIWLAVYARVLSSEGQARGVLRRTFPHLLSGATFFAVSLVPATLLAFQYGLGGWQLAVLGLFGYLSPLIAALTGYAFARYVTDVHRLLVFYSLVSALMLIGTPLEYLGVFNDSPAIGTEALGARWVRYTGGGVVNLHSGFFRSPDVMGWHAATLVMLSLAIAMQRRSRTDRLWLLVAAWGGLCLVLAGRRKMTMMPVVWAACLLFAFVGSGRFKRAVALVSVGIALAFGVSYASGEFDVRESYYVYAGTVTTEGPVRVIDDAWNSVWITYAQSGFLGLGLGAASQGTRYLSVTGAGSWQESGPSKVMAELGVPGFACGLLLAWRVARALQKTTRESLRTERGAASGVPLMGFVVANAACFTISHQVYSDAVILTMTALILGIVLGSQRWTTTLQPRRAPLPGKAWARPAPIEQAG
jgi:hypothetical protein